MRSIDALMVVIGIGKWVCSTWQYLSAYKTFYCGIISWSKPSRPDSAYRLEAFCMCWNVLGYILATVISVNWREIFIWSAYRVANMYQTGFLFVWSRNVFGRWIVVGVCVFSWHEIYNRVFFGLVVCELLSLLINRRLMDSYLAGSMQSRLFWFMFVSGLDLWHLTNKNYFGNVSWHVVMTQNYYVNIYVMVAAKFDRFKKANRWWIGAPIVKPTSSIDEPVFIRICVYTICTEKLETYAKRSSCNDVTLWCLYSICPYQCFPTSVSAAFKEIDQTNFVLENYTETSIYVVLEAHKENFM